MCFYCSNRLYTTAHITGFIVTGSKINFSVDFRGVPQQEHAVIYEEVLNS